MLRLTYEEQAHFAEQLREGLSDSRRSLTDRELVARISELMKGPLGAKELGHDVSREVLQLSRHLTSDAPASVKKLSRNAMLLLVDCVEASRHPGVAVFVCRVAVAEAQSETGRVKNYKAPSLLPAQEDAATDFLLRTELDPLESDDDLVAQACDVLGGYSSMWSTPFVGRLRRSAEHLIQALSNENMGEVERAIARNALRYLVWDEDIINDSLGLIGLVDDAFVLDGAVKLIFPDTGPWLEILDEVAQKAPYLTGLALQWNGKSEQVSEYILTNFALASPVLRGSDPEQTVVVKVVDTGPLPTLLAFLEALSVTYARIQARENSSLPPREDGIPYEKGDLVLVDGKAVAEYDGLEVKFNPPRLRLKYRAGPKALPRCEFLPVSDLRRLQPAPDGRKVFGKVARSRAKATAEVSVLERLFHLEWREKFSQPQAPVVLVTGLGYAKQLLGGLRVLGDPLLKVLPIGAITDAGDHLTLERWNQIGDPEAQPALMVARTPELAAEYLDSNEVKSARVYIDGERTAGWNQQAIEQFEGLAPATLVTSTDDTRALRELAQAGAKLWTWKSSDLGHLIWPVPQPGHPLSELASRTARSIGEVGKGRAAGCGSLTLEVVHENSLAPLAGSLRELNSGLRQQREVSIEELVEVTAKAHQLFRFVRLAVMPLGALEEAFSRRHKEFERACLAALESKFLSSDEKELIVRVRAELNEVCLRLHEVNPKAAFLEQLLARDGELVPVLAVREDLDQLRFRTKLELPRATTVMSKVPSVAPERGLIAGWSRQVARWIDPIFAHHTYLLLYDVEVRSYERWRRSQEKAQHAIELLTDRNGFFDVGKTWPAESLRPKRVSDEIHEEADLETLDDEATRVVTQMLVQRSHSSATRTQSLVPAYRVSFGEDSFIFATEYFRAPTATHLLSGEARLEGRASLRDKGIHQLQIGDVVVFRGGSDRDAIREAADEILPEGLRATAAVWNQALRRWVDAQGVGPEDLQKRLAECGCRRTPQTVVKWLQDPNMIGPKDTGRGALRAIAEATGDVSLKARIDECAAAIHKVRAAHLQASHRLAQLVLQAVAKEVDGQVFEDYLRLEDGTLLCRVTDLDRATIEVASGSTNRLLNLGVAE